VRDVREERTEAGVQDVRPVPLREGGLTMKAIDFPDLLWSTLILAGMALSLVPA
jgi:hypothetical protein